MEGRPEAAPLLALAARAEALGYDSVWVGNSLLARLRHEPLTLLAGVAGRVPRVELGTAVLLPGAAQSGAAGAPVATLDQVSEGRLILGVRLAFGSAEHPGGVRIGGRAVREATGADDGRPAAVQGVVDRAAGGLGRALAGDAGRAGADAVSGWRPAAVDRRQSAGEPGAGGAVLRRLVSQCA